MERHVDDQDLLLSVDGELSPRRRSRVARHVESCHHCQDRASRLRSVLDDVAHGYRMQYDAGRRAPDYGRMRLEFALREAAVSSPRAWFAPVARFSFAPVLAVGVVVVCAFLLGARGGSETTVASLPTGTLPEASLTPGAVSPLTAAELCNGVRPSRWVTDSLRQQVVRAYGMEGVAAGAYELDALITPELGGSTDAANLWPQRFHAPVWNARVKDELERLLPEMVCRGEISLAEAQQEIATDWIAAYKRHFRTDAPLRAHMAPFEEESDELLFVADRPAAAQIAMIRLVSR